MEKNAGSEELDYASYANVVRRHIAKTADILSHGGFEAANQGWHTVRALSGLLDPYKPDGFNEELKALIKDLQEKADDIYTWGHIPKEREAITPVYREMSHRVFRRLMALARKVGFLKE